MSWIGAEIAFICCLMLPAAYLGFKCRDLPSQYNESSHIQNALVVLMFFAVIIIPLDIFIFDNPEAAVLIQGLGQAFLCIILTAIVFGPKLYYLTQPSGRTAIGRSVLATDSVMSGLPKEGSEQSARAAATSQQGKTAAAGSVRTSNVRIALTSNPTSIKSLKSSHSTSRNKTPTADQPAFDFRTPPLAPVDSSTHANHSTSTASEGGSAAIGPSSAGHPLSSDTSTSHLSLSPPFSLSSLPTPTPVSAVDSTVPVSPTHRRIRVHTGCSALTESLSQLLKRVDDAAARVEAHGQHQFGHPPIDHDDTTQSQIQHTTATPTQPDKCVSLTVDRSKECNQ